MTTPTSNPVPSNSPQDLLFNAEKLDEVVNAEVPLYLDRFGRARLTAQGAIDSIKSVNSRGAWAAATAYASKDLALVSGTWYIAVESHTSSASFATDAAKWRVYQGVTGPELAASTGTDLVGYGLQTLTQVLAVIRTADNFKLPGDPNDALSFVRMAEFSNGSIRLAAREYVVGNLTLPLYNRLEITGMGVPMATASLDQLAGGTIIVGGVNARAGSVLLRDFGVDNGSARGATGAVDGLVVNSPTGGTGAEAILANIASMGPTSAGATHGVLVQGYSRGSAKGIYCAKHQFGLVSKNRNFVIDDVDGDDCRTALVYPKSDLPEFAGEVADGTALNYEISNVQHRAGLTNIEASAVYLHASTASFASARVVNVSQVRGLAALRIQAGGSITDPAISGINASNIRGEGSQYAAFVGGFTYDWTIANLEAVNPPTGRVIYMDSNAFGWSLSGIRCLISDPAITADVVMAVYGSGVWDNLVVRNPFRTMRVDQNWFALPTVKTGAITGQGRNLYDTDLTPVNSATADVAPAVPRMRILPGSVMKLEGRFNMTAATNKVFCNLPVSTGRQMVFSCAAIDSGGNYVNQAVRLNDGGLSVEPSLPAGLQRIDISNITVAL